MLVIFYLEDVCLLLAFCAVERVLFKRFTIILTRRKNHLEFELSYDRAHFSKPCRRYDFSFWSESRLWKWKQCVTRSLKSISSDQQRAARHCRGGAKTCLIISLKLSKSLIMLMKFDLESMKKSIKRILIEI